MLTEQEIVDIVKSGKEYRMDHMYSIVNKQGELVPFSRNRMQKDFAENHSNKDVMLKSRQLWATTDATIDMLDDVLFTPNFEALLIAHTQEDMGKLFDKKVYKWWESLDPLLKELWCLENSSAKEMKFGFWDGTTSSFSVALSGRSGTYQRMHISEYWKICAKYPQKAEEIKTGAFPAVPSTGRLSIESTAEGADWDFNAIFMTAWNRQGCKNFRKWDKKRDSEFAAFFYNWTWDDDEISKVTDIEANLPKYFIDLQIKHSLTDQEITFYYYKWVSFGGNEKAYRQLKQEYPTTPEDAFATSGNKLFDQEKLSLQVASEAIRRDWDWRIFSEYKSSHRYAIGVDPAEGIGGDHSAIVVWDFFTDAFILKPKVVATYKNNNIAPDKLAYLVRDIWNRYWTCLVAVERNNHGHTTLSKLREIYPKGKIFTEIREDYITKEKTEKMWWHSNMTTKPKIFFDMALAIEQEAVEIRDGDILHEMRVYDRDKLNEVKTDPNATNHFDLLTACTIWYHMRNQVKTVSAVPLWFGWVKPYM